MLSPGMGAVVGVTRAGVGIAVEAATGATVTLATLAVGLGVAMFPASSGHPQATVLKSPFSAADTTPSPSASPSFGKRKWHAMVSQTIARESRGMPMCCETTQTRSCTCLSKIFPHYPPHRCFVREETLCNAGTGNTQALLEADRLTRKHKITVTIESVLRPNIPKGGLVQPLLHAHCISSVGSFVSQKGEVPVQTMSTTSSPAV